MACDLVSVIMPTFNECRFLVESIESVLHQSYSNLELLITDDHSVNAQVREILTDYATRDARVRVFFLEENKGPGYARNNSIEQAKGRYIAFCDSDDRWAIDKLEKQVAFMKQTNACLSYTSYYRCNQSGKITGVVEALKKMPFRTLKHDNKIGCLTAMYDTYVCGKRFMPSMRKRQDWALFLSIVKEYGTAYGLTEPLAYYRNRKASVSTKKCSLVKYNAMVYQKVLHYSVLKSYLYVLFVFMPVYGMKRIKYWWNNRLFSQTTES